MILILATEERLSARLIRELELRREPGSRHTLARGEGVTLATVGEEPVHALGRAAYIAGSVESSQDGEQLRAFLLLVPAPEHDGAAPGIALKIAGAPLSPIYPDPVITSPLEPGELHSEVAAAIMGWASTLYATDQLYAVTVPRGGDAPSEEAIPTVIAHIRRLREELPEERDILSTEQERALQEIAEGLRLSVARRELLFREARGRLVRSGTLPAGISGYTLPGGSLRATRERRFNELIRLLRDTADG